MPATVLARKRRGDPCAAPKLGSSVRPDAVNSRSSGKYIAKITPPAGSGIGATTISGNPATSVTNGAGQTATYTYNDRYGLSSASTTAGRSFTYDADDRVTSRTDKNQHVTYLYNSRGTNVDTYTYGRDNQAGIPALEVATTTGAADPTIIDNDAAGRAIDYQEGAYAQFLMYDGLGRMIGTIDTTGYNDSTYHLDPYAALLSVTSGGTATATTANTKTTTLSAATAGAGQSPYAAVAFRRT